MMTLFLIMGCIAMLILTVVGLITTLIEINDGNFSLGLLMLGMSTLPVIVIIRLLNELGII